MEEWRRQPTGRRRSVRGSHFRANLDQLVRERRHRPVFYRLRHRQRAPVRATAILWRSASGQRPKFCLWRTAAARECFCRGGNLRASGLVRTKTSGAG
jgi:hypothetical protein